MKPSCLQTQEHLDDSYTLQSTHVTGGTTLVISETQFFLCSQKTLSRIFHLSNAGLFLITTNFLAPDNQHNRLSNAFYSGL